MHLAGEGVLHHCIELGLEGGFVLHPDHGAIGGVHHAVLAFRVDEGLGTGAGADGGEGADDVLD